MKTPSTRIAIAVAASLGLPMASASAAEVKLPKAISWTAYGTTSSGYAQSVGLGQMLKKRFGVDLRIIPGKNDVSRMAPMRVGQTQICACGIAAYFAQEGVLMFAEKSWGPQRIYNLFNNVGRNGQQAMTAADAGILKVSDLKGKRVTFVKGAPALNTNMTAMLAFGGLTWADVKKVEVPGWKQSIEAVINGQADAAWGSTISSAYAQLAASPRGLYFPPLPHADKAAWDRAKAVAPWWAPTKILAYTKGAKNQGPYEGSNYPYPIFVAVKGISDDLAYGLTKAVMEHYQDFKESGPGMDGYQLSAQNLAYVFPYHPAAIKYYKEKGVWTAAHEQHNQMLLKRQDVLAAAWKDMQAKKVADDKFVAEWLKVRAAA
ncbi:MAG: TAXI family TRAP transporter solute-binding subunit, partial [Hyphomicrobiaceae bacterium]|nr:TAXI family TRAP transporter solute-binding subunit [Hyphomicrobiaceae bacterium]